jgi:hypothetical protein
MKGKKQDMPSALRNSQDRWMFYLLCWGMKLQQQVPSTRTARFVNQKKYHSGVDGLREAPASWQTQLAKQKKKAVATSGESFGNALTIKHCVKPDSPEKRVIGWFRPVAPSLPAQKLAHSPISVEVVAAASSSEALLQNISRALSAGTLTSHLHSNNTNKLQATQ